MKTLPLILLGFLCTFSLVANGRDGKHKLTPEQQALRKEIIEKYDTDKNGKLDRKERASISKEDKKRLRKAGFHHKLRHRNRKGV
jgi:hypothetical protein